ncbi:uncharacterized protein T551_02441 [Pneumocystis jirovecii RU7]|uniref:Uncharacterized protein n=1 Tax=Pneumocystis jirovecii (strain RU7) TaxID=1408657 RepID=A0A0W4ZJQ0_PNEJ7|nr:uncharacterized protein T551_02441 [Pneumocystis jirovecii RU7]KTW28591.1 hypothetical protein T551_02441 [Pneumocystis jirovecii RU7]
MSKKKTYPSFNHVFQQAILKEKPIIDGSYPLSCTNQINGSQYISTNLQNSDNALLSPETLKSRMYSIKTRELCKEFKGTEYAENINTFEYKNISMNINSSKNQDFFTSKKPFVNRNFSENFDTKKKVRSHRYSVSDHISQMSTWQNSLISEFGMLPTLPCIPYFLVLDDSDEYSDISYNESIISIHDLHAETIDDNISNLVFPDGNFMDIRSRIPSLNSTGFHKGVTLMSNDPKYLKLINPSQDIGIESKTIVPLEYNNVKSFETIVSKRRSKFKFPKIKFCQRYNDNFAKAVVPAKHNNKILSDIKTISHLSGHVNSSPIINSDPNIRSDSMVLKKKAKESFLPNSTIKQNKTSIKNYNFFRKFIFKSFKKTKKFKNEGTQTYISMFNGFLSRESQTLKGFPKDFFLQEKNANSFKNLNIYKSESMPSNLGINYANIEKQSSVISGYLANLSYQKEMHSNKKMPLKANTSNKNASTEANISDYYIPSKPSTCFCTCTCLCETCCGFSKTKHVLRRRPSSIVFVEIAASRKPEKYSDILDFDEDFDDKIATAMSKTYISDTSPDAN